MRSFRLNFELNVEIYHSTLVAQLEQFITQKQEVRLSPELLKKTSLPITLRNSAARLMLPYL
jgi:cardiolipin synthase